MTAKCGSSCDPVCWVCGSLEPCNHSILPCIVLVILILVWLWGKGSVSATVRLMVTAEVRGHSGPVL